MSKYTSETLIAHVGELMGIPDLRFDDEGDCQFLIDERLELSIQNLENRLVVFVVLCRYLPAREAKIALDIARGNYFWAGTGGATLSMNDTDHTVILAEQFALETLAPASFAQTLDGFVSIAQYWQQRLATHGVDNDINARISDQDDTMAVLSARV